MPCSLPHARCAARSRLVVELIASPALTGQISTAVNYGGSARPWPDPFGYLQYAPVVPTIEPAVARTQITDPTGQTYELQLMDGASLDDPDRPPASDILSRLGARIARRFASSVAQSPKDVQTFTIRVVLLRGDQRELQCTFFTDLVNRDTQIARITDAITTGTFDPERSGE
jgi:hypothetical protein